MTPWPGNSVPLGCGARDTIGRMQTQSPLCNMLSVGQLFFACVLLYLLLSNIISNFFICLCCLYGTSVSKCCQLTLGDCFHMTVACRAELTWIKSLRE